jgi:hypothetical protein
MTNKNDKNQNKKKINYEPQTSAPRKTRRGGTKNANPSSVSHYAPGLLAARLLHRASDLLSTGWQNLRRRLPLRRKSQSLRVLDVASLGDKRFVAVVQYGRRRFLVGGGAGSVSLLSKLGREDLPEPLHAERETRSSGSSLPLIPAAAAEASPFNVKIAEATAGARLAI